jgi:putative thioredoxin
MSAPYVSDVSEATFADEVLRRSQDLPVVVDFWAEWCAPCRMLSPVLERLAVEAAGTWVLAKVDVDANPALAASYGVRGIPAVHGFRGGREVSRFVGALPEPSVRRWLDEVLGPSAEDRARALILERAAGADEPALRERLEADPGDVEATGLLAEVEFARGDVEAALQRLIGAVRAGGPGRERARRHLLEMLDALSPDDPRALAARRDLANALF